MKGELKSKAQLIYKEFITNAHTHTRIHIFTTMLTHTELYSTRSFLSFPPFPQSIF